LVSVEVDPRKILENMIWVLELVSSHLIGIELVIEIMFFRLEIFTFVELLKLNSFALVFFPFLILRNSAKKESILILFFPVLNHLDEFVSNGISNSLEKLALLAAEDRHWVLGQSQQDSLVAETLVSKIFEICVFFQLNELVHIILVERV
jgi:hypothetical protein